MRDKAWGTWQDYAPPGQNTGYQSWRGAATPFRGKTRLGQQLMPVRDHTPLTYATLPWTAGIYRVFFVLGAVAELVGIEGGEIDDTQIR